MPIFKLNRNYVLRSKLGHSIAFIKGEPTHVPNELANECVHIGAEQLDGETIVTSDETIAPRKDFDELFGLMIESFKEIVMKNDPDDFTGQGIPKVAVIERMIGENLSKHQVVDAWQKFRSDEV